MRYLQIDGEMLKLAVTRAMAKRATQDIEMDDTHIPGSQSHRRASAVARQHPDDGAPHDIDKYINHIDSIVKLQRFFRVIARGEVASYSS